MRRSQPSKRRWKARAKAGKWIPSAVIFALDKRQDLGDTYEMHPTEWGFMRLRRMCGGIAEEAFWGKSDAEDAGG